MQTAPYVEALQADLEELAGVGDESVAEAARRLSAALRSALGLRLLDALSEAALELNAQLPSGHVEVRLAGGDASLVYVEEEPSVAAAQPAEDGLTARITLRLPEGLKGALELAASSEGLSVNAWLVRVLTRAVSTPSITRGPGSRMTGFAKS